MFPPAFLIGMSEWITAIGTTLTATALIAIVALLWRMQERVSSVVGGMTLIEQKIDANNKESNLRFQMVDQKFAHLQSEVERQGAMIEEQRRWKTHPVGERED
jgi:hypothetical protein